MKFYIDPSQRIGITEAGEPAYNLDLFDNLYAGNIIITKSLTDKLIEKILKNKAKIILHLTCTGHGGTKLEPMVPAPEKTHSQLQKLIAKGFPARQIVLRIDPIIPTIEGRETAYKVAVLFSDCGISRLRFSSLDLYNHVKERFHKSGYGVPYATFHASRTARLELYKGLRHIGKKYGYEIEACAEPGIESVSCLSQKDIEILRLEKDITLKASAEQRTHCGCPANKSELIRKGRPHRCQNQCLYCFWKD